MPLETATYISQLNAADPVHADGVNQGDAHLRLLKAVLQAQFPNLGAAAVTPTAAQLNALVSALQGSGSTVSIRGLDGSVPVGSIHMFPRDPGSSVCARGGVATGTEQFILLDGSTYAQSKFPVLGASAFVTISAPNFAVDNLMDTGRFIRSTNGVWSGGTKQSNQNAAHTHTATVNDPGHSHNLNDPGHNHAVSDPGHNHTVTTLVPGSPLTGVGSSGASGTATTSTNTTGISILGNGTGITMNSATTAVSVTNASQGGTEARPEAYVAYFALKT